MSSWSKVVDLAEKAKAASTLDELLSLFEAAGPVGVRWRTKSEKAGLQYAYAAWWNRSEGRYVVAEAIADASGRILKRNVFTGSYGGDDFVRYFSWELFPQLTLHLEFTYADFFADRYANVHLIAGAVRMRELTGDPEGNRRRIGELADRWWRAEYIRELDAVHKEAENAGFLTTWSTFYSGGGGYQYHVLTVFDPLSGAYLIGEAITEGKGATNWRVIEKKAETGVLKEMEEFRRNDCIVVPKLFKIEGCYHFGRFPPLIQVEALCRNIPEEELVKKMRETMKESFTPPLSLWRKVEIPASRLSLPSRFRQLSSTEPREARERVTAVESRAPERGAAAESAQGGSGEKREGEAAKEDEEDVEASAAVSWLLGKPIRVTKREREDIEKYLKKWGVKVP